MLETSIPARVHANRMAANHVRDSGLSFSGAIPFVQNGVFALGAKLDALVPQKGIGGHAHHDRRGDGHDDNQRISRSIREPTLFERVLVDIL